MKTNKFFLISAALVCALACSATRFEVNGINYNTLGGDSVEVSGEYYYSGAIVIPSTVTYETITYRVTSIGNYAFSDCTGLTSLTIPNSVTSIGDYAFYYCRGLTSPVYDANCFAYMPTTYSGSYTIPDGIKQIAGGAFYRCSGLTSVTIPNSVTSIGESAFYGCSGLTAVNIGNSVTSIGGSTFAYCSGLTSITIPNSVTSIGDSAFWSCSGLTAVTIPNSVISIGSWAFFECSGLTSITIPNSVIGNYAFCNCSGLTSVNIGNSVTSIGYGAFAECSGLTSVTIPNSVTSIESKAFENCTSLKSVTIGNGIISIGNDVFAGCTYLKQLVLGENVTNIAAGAFANSIKLFDIYCYSEEAPIADETSFANYNVYLHVLCEYKRNYELDPVFGNFKYIECIGASEQTLTTDEVIVVPAQTDAVFTWPQNDAASSYTLEITKDGVVFCTLTFNESGQLTGLSFAPSKTGEVQSTGFKFTVTGLDEACLYSYNFDAKDSGGNVLKNYNGTFSTDGYVGVKQVTIPGLYAENGRVVCENAQDMRIYTLTGIDVTRENGHLQGVYVVKCGEQTQKIVVK